MIRVSLSFTAAQMAGLRALAAEQNTSIAAVVREAVDDAMAREARRRKRAHALAAISALRASAPADLAERHDAYLGSQDP